MYGKALIEKARALGYRDKETAALIGVTPSYISKVCAGTKRLSPPCAALLAQLVGEDATDALKGQTIDNEPSEQRKTGLRAALFTSWAGGVVLALTATVTDDALAATVALGTVYTLCAVHRARLNRCRPAPPAWSCPATP